MTVEMETTVDLGVFMENLLRKVVRDLDKTVLQAAEHAAGIIRETIYSTFKNPRGGLARSFRVALLEPEDGKIRAGAISDLVYAEIQNTGEPTIVPKTVKRLAVPIGHRARTTAGLWPRDWGADGLEFAGWSKKGNPLLGKKGREGKSDYLQYVLVKAVVLKPTYYLDWSNEIAKREIPKLFDEAIQSSIDSVEPSKEIK